MSAGLIFDSLGHQGGDKTRLCSVVSIYEDFGGRDLLIELCDSLVGQFKDDLEFEVDWWRFKFLADPEIASEAAYSAAHANLILLAAKSPELPAHVQNWFDGWSPHRQNSDGALVLVQSEEKAGKPSLPMRTFLRLTAARARLDYLRLGPPVNRLLMQPRAIAGFPLCQPNYNDLLSSDERPTDWGINE